MTGDWRSNHYGADRLAHLFDWGLFASRKTPVCGVRDNGKYLKRETTRTNACRECQIRIAVAP